MATGEVKKQVDQWGCTFQTIATAHLGLCSMRLLASQMIDRACVR